MALEDIHKIFCTSNDEKSVEQNVVPQNKPKRKASGGSDDEKPYVHVANTYLCSPAVLLQYLKYSIVFKKAEDHRERQR